MRYGVILSFQDPPDSPVGHADVYDAGIEAAIAADEQGYEWINVTEHHVAADGYLPALLVVLGALATATDQIRLSTGMLILTLHNPVRIAEEAAVLDLLSHGRLTLGVAAGYREIEFIALGSDRRRRGVRFDESLEILHLAWSGEPFSYNGSFFQLPEIVVRPRPAQRPGVPLWIGGTSEPALRRAVREGSACFPGSTSTVEAIVDDFARYRRLREEARSDGPPELVVPRLALVADSRREARRRALPGIRSVFQTYQSWGVPIDFSEILADWRLLDELVLVGDEEHCAAEAERYAALGATDLMLHFGLPGIDPSVAAESQARMPRMTSARLTS